MRRIVAGLKREHDGHQIPVTLFTKGGGMWLEAIADSGCNAVGLDWTVDIDTARERIGERVALQGNLDPCVLYADPDTIRERARDIIQRFGNHPGHVFNLGHGIHQAIEPENVKVLVDAVHEFGRDIRNS